jgi:hypothetical protein
MVDEMFIEVYEINLEFFYLHILIIIFPCVFKDFYGIYWLRKEGVTHLKMTIKKSIRHNYVL